MRRFSNWLSAPARIDALREQAIAAIGGRLPFHAASELSTLPRPRAVGFLRARLRRAVHDYLDQLERTQPGLVAGRRQQLFAEIRERLVEQMIRENARSAVALGASCQPHSGTALALPAPRKAA